MVAQLTLNQLVVGSNPTSPKKLFSNKNYEACASFFVTKKHTNVKNTGKTRSFAGILKLDDSDVGVCCIANSTGAKLIEKRVYTLFFASFEPKTVG